MSYDWQVMCPRLVSDFCAMAASHEWRERPGVSRITCLCDSYLHRDVTVEEINQLETKLLEVMKQNPSQV